MTVFSNPKIAAKFVLFTLLIWAWVFSTSSFASLTSKSPLPSDQAFQFSVAVKNPNELRAEWHITPGYYLYAKRMHIAFTPKTVADFHFPYGEMKRENIHKPLEIYTGTLSIPITLHTKDQKLQLSVDYQGCSKEGFCYPPAHKNIMLNLADHSFTQNNNTSQQDRSFQSLLTDHDSVRALFQSQHPAVLLLVFVGLGLLLAFTPCVLPMIPILTGIILGQKNGVGTWKAFLLSLTYVLSMAITYAIAGLAAASLGSSLQIWLQNPWVIGFISGLFILLGLSLFGFYDLRISPRWHNRINSWSNRHEGGSYAGVFFMGVLSTLVVSPCVTAPLAGVLIYIGQTGNLFFGASALFAMGMGMGIPLVLVGVSAGKFLPKSGAWMKAVKEIFGILMLAMAIWMLSRVVSHTVVMMLWAILLTGAAIFLGFYLPLYLPGHIVWRKLTRSLGMIVGVFGIIVMLGGAGVSTLLKAASTNQFVVVHNLGDLNKQLLLAKEEHHPVMLDFYADWCESCVSMDHHVFNRSNVQKALGDFVLLRADLSANLPSDVEILKHFDVIAPPTMLFFNHDGREVNSHRIIGELNAKEFLGRLNLFMEEGKNAG